MPYLTLFISQLATEFTAINFFAIVIFIPLISATFFSSVKPKVVRLANDSVNGNRFLTLGNGFEILATTFNELLYIFHQFIYYALSSVQLP